MNDRTPIRVLTPAAIGAAAVFAFGGSPLLAFADPANLFAATYALGGGVMTVVLYDRIGQRSIVAKLGGILVAAGLIGLFAVAMNALTVARAMHARCAALEADMMSANPRKGSGPELFSALGCRPTGKYRLEAPPTAKERLAGKPLPSGGRFSRVKRADH